MCKADFGRPLCPLMVNHTIFTIRTLGTTEMAKMTSSAPFWSLFDYYVKGFFRPSQPQKKTKVPWCPKRQCQPKIILTGYVPIRTGIYSTLLTRACKLCTRGWTIIQGCRPRFPSRHPSCISAASNKALSAEQRVLQAETRNRRSLFARNSQPAQAPRRDAAPFLARQRYCSGPSEQDADDLRTVYAIFILNQRPSP